MNTLRTNALRKGFCRLGNDGFVKSTKSTDSALRAERSNLIIDLLSRRLPRRFAPRSDVGGLFTTLSRNEEGSVLVIAFIFLVILTLIGIFATRTAQMDMQIASNEIPYKRSFYIAEGGLYREAAELGRSNYPVTNVAVEETLARRLNGVVDTGDPLPSPTDHTVFGQGYDFTVTYLGFFPPPAGFSAIDYVRYDYNVDVTANKVNVNSRLYRIGPKPE